MATKVYRRPAGASQLRPAGQIRKLSVEEGWKLLDERARRYLGIDATEFLRRWDAGEYRLDVERREVSRVAAAIPFARGTTISGR